VSGQSESKEEERDDVRVEEASSTNRMSSGEEGGRF